MANERNDGLALNAGRKDSHRSGEAAPSAGLSLAQQIARDAWRSSADWEQPGSGQPISVAELRRMAGDELVAVAAECGVDNPSELPSEELRFEILKKRVANGDNLCSSGTLQVLPDGFGFLRSAEFLYSAGPDDVYVSPSQIRRFHLKSGCVVSGQIRPPKGAERFFAMLRIHAVNDVAPEHLRRLAEFDSHAPLHPNTRIRLEHGADDYSLRILDLVAPLGFGQRGLIVGPPQCGKTTLLQSIARGVLANHPLTFVFVLLIDERPEEITEVCRGVQGSRCEIVGSTFAEPPARHVQAAEMVLEKAKRLVEAGNDVVILLDSLTRLAQAWHYVQPPAEEPTIDGLDARAIQAAKKLFGAARRIEGGGSLTIIATLLRDWVGRSSESIYESFQGAGNWEIELDAELARRQIWPAMNPHHSGARREDRFLLETELASIRQLRNLLRSKSPLEAMTFLASHLPKHSTNAEWLRESPIAAEA